MKNKGKRKFDKMKSNLKKGMIFTSLIFIAGGVFMNSSYVSSRQDEVYAELKNKYRITVQEEPNVIEETNISNNDNKKFSLTVDSSLRELSNFTEEDYERMLQGTSLASLGKTLVEIENTYNINGMYMIGLAAVESGFGTSNIAVTKNNITGYCAYDSNTSKAKVFNSYADCLKVTARHLDKNYLTEGGAYHEGLSARSIDVHYCTDKRHADKIVNVAHELIKKLG